MDIYELGNQKVSGFEGNRLLRQMVDGTAQDLVQCHSLKGISLSVHSSVM